MAEREELEQLFLGNLDRIDRTASFLAHRHHFTPVEAEEFAACVRLRLVEDDYAILAKFRGESSLPTYLAVVIAGLLRDYRVQRWGRWRPSAAARSRGEVAVRLETMVYRDGCSFQHAVAALRSAGQTQLSDRQLSDLLAQLPRRTAIRPVEVRTESVPGVASPESPDASLMLDDTEQERQRTEQALARAIATLGTEDQVILRMRFWEDVRVADIARALDLPQKSLYRRLERALRQVRQELLATGMSRDDIKSLLGALDP